jgi:hypothetical protein
MANQTNNSASTSSTPTTTLTKMSNNNNNTTTTSTGTPTTTSTSINLPTVVVTTATQQQQAAAAAAQNLLTNSSSSNTTTHSALLQNTNAILDVVLCKLNTPYHIINDPRLLDCGHSACLQCIIQMKDTDKNLKCIYCNSIHKIPLDTSKLTVNKNLQTFIKYNFKQNLNQNFLKQFEDSMTSLEGIYIIRKYLKNLVIFFFFFFCFVEKFQTQTANAENLDQYLNLVENDVQTKIENMKVSLEKLGEQFCQNIRTIRKELQK